MTDPVELHPLLRRDLQRVYDRLRASGELRAPEKLQQYYQTFQERFGPTALLAHDGDALLSLTHETKRDGLIYWLEFKDDDEFPSIFGSIAGGSALKYGFYRRRETGEWMTGAPRAQRAISTAEAVVLAHRDRDQLLAASRLLSQFPPGASPQDYLALQQELARVAPDVQNSAWGHKYLSLIHPDGVPRGIGRSPRPLLFDHRRDQSWRYSADLVGRKRTAADDRRRHEYAAQLAYGAQAQT